MLYYLLFVIIAQSKASEELARSEREARELMTTQCKQGGTRQETWVHPDGSKQKEDLYKRSLATGGVDVDHLKQLSPVEVSKINCGKCNCS